MEEGRRRGESQDEGLEVADVIEKCREDEHGEMSQEWTGVVMVGRECR